MSPPPPSAKPAARPPPLIAFFSSQQMLFRSPSLPSFHRLDPPFLCLACDNNSVYRPRNEARKMVCPLCCFFALFPRLDFRTLLSFVVYSWVLLAFLSLFFWVGGEEQWLVISIIVICVPGGGGEYEHACVWARRPIVCLPSKCSTHTDARTKCEWGQRSTGDTANGRSELSFDEPPTAAAVKASCTFLSSI